MPDDRRPPLTPQLALRIAVLGGVALTMFAIVFFRLWFLQVLSGDQYLRAASVNRTRTVPVAAPRGQILDRSGSVLVDSVRARAVLISPTALPVALGQSPVGQPLPAPPFRDVAVYTRLARVLRVSTRRGPCPVAGHGVARLSLIACKVAQGYALLPYANVTVKTGVAPAVHYYIAERQDQFPGVNVEPVYLRRYPLGSLAAQVDGTVGPISCVSPTNCEIHQSHYRGASQNDVVGQSGLEYYYDHYLRGVDGGDRIQINAAGQPTGALPLIKPTPGYTLKLSLDVGLQKAGEQALQQAIDANSPANGGSFVALDPQNGEVLAMGSNPQFDPNIFTKPVPASTYTQLNNPARNFPLINRTIQSAGPTGSTFKPITATAALQSGAWSLSDTFDDTGKFCIGIQCRTNAGGAVYGPLDLVNAIRVSSDDFFYNLGRATNVDPTLHPNGGALQRWARRYGIGRPTGIDLGGEVPGNLPTPRGRARVDQLELQCEHATGPYAGKPRHSSCGIADGRPWSVGDNISLGIGQGDVQATPLQLAVAYAAIANGGNVVRPHLGLEVDSSDGTLQRKIDPPPSRHINIAAQNLDAIRQGLRDAASQPGGTSVDVFGNFPEQVYGKTGTAQYNGQQDYSWYACFVPATATSTPIVVVVNIQQGGFGAAAAAPAARQILSQWFFRNKGKFVAGSSKTL
ncbi:MAG: penicillin-binding transpeptidase domain-containing protein [Solirubrobacteraceae bacterium]